MVDNRGFKQARGKILQVLWSEANHPEREGKYLVEISESHAYTLLTQIQYLRWKTRWLDYEDWDEVLAYVDDLEVRLLTPIECEVIEGMTEEEFKALVCAALDECLVPQLQEWYNNLMAAIASIEATVEETNTTVNNINTVINDVDTTVNNINSTVTNINNVTNITNIGTAPPTQKEKTGEETIIETRPPAGGLTDEQFYGICISIVDGIVDAMVDWFEILEQISNAAELAGIVGEAVPVIGDAAAAAANLANFIQETAVENFLAADTLPRRLQLADLLYCKGKDIKALTLPMIGEALAECYIGDLINWGDPIGSLAEVATGVFIAEQVFYITLGIGLAVWTVTGDFQGLITRSSWRFWVNRGKASPQSPVPDCDTSDAWEVVFDFTLGTNGFVSRNDTGPGSIRTAEGWISSGYVYGGGIKESGCKRTISIDAPSITTEVEVEYFNSSTNDGLTWLLALQGNTYYPPYGTGLQTVTWPIAWNGAGEISYFMHFYNPQADNACQVRKITIRGTGPEPTF